jgi:hypothetical protein
MCATLMVHGPNGAIRVGILGRARSEGAMPGIRPWLAASAKRMAAAQRKTVAVASFLEPRK